MTVLVDGTTLQTVLVPWRVSGVQTVRVTGTVTVSGTHFVTQLVCGTISVTGLQLV